MSSITVVPVEQATGGVNEITPLLLPPAGQYYQQRAARLRHLAQGHEQADYLLFAAQVAQAQQALLQRFPVPADEVQAVVANPGPHVPLAAERLVCSGYWQAALQQLIEQLMPGAGPVLADALASLAHTPPEQREGAADHLLQGRYDQVNSGQAVLLWAALMLYAGQLAAALPVTAKAAVGEHRQYCPVCGSAPIASVIMTGKRNGLRYLHCSLCESRWHMVRVKCSNCEQTGKLDYWSLDRQASPVKAESCGDCGSYLKVLYGEHDQGLEVVADDLGSLVLDAEMQREGFARSSFNPFLFPG